jgi:hypothetical protein
MTCLYKRGTGGSSYETPLTEYKAKVFELVFGQHRISAVQESHGIHERIWHRADIFLVIFAESESDRTVLKINKNKNTYHGLSGTI